MEKIFVTNALSKLGKVLIEAITSEEYRNKYTLCGASDPSVKNPEMCVTNGHSYQIFPEFTNTLRPDIVIDVSAFTRLASHSVFNNVLSYLTKHVSCILITPQRFMRPEACLELDKYRPNGVGLLIAPEFSTANLLIKHFAQKQSITAGIQAIADEEAQAPEKHLYIKGIFSAIDHLASNKDFIVGLEKILF